MLSEEDLFLSEVRTALNTTSRDSSLVLQRKKEKAQKHLWVSSMDSARIIAIFSLLYFYDY